MKTAISIPDELSKTADAAAKALGLSRSALIQRALEDFLDHRNQKSIVEKLNQVYSRIDSSIPGEIKNYQKDHLNNENW
jgi:metal-responsive CopG/Arc/MetJ family transcriptional regulator